MHEFLEFTVIGIVAGAAYAVAACGLVVTYSTSGIFNISHGAIGMFMAFVYWQLIVPWHINQALGLVLVVLIGAPLMGAIIERGVIRRVPRDNVSTTLVITVGLTLILIGAAQEIWKNQSPVMPYFFAHSHGFGFLGVRISWEEFITVCAAIAIAAGLRIFLYRSRLGIAMRGVVDNRELIGLFGGRPSWYSTLSWAIGASLASIGGILLAPIIQLNAILLTLLVIDAYAAAMVGKLRSLPLTFAGAIGLGLVTSYTSYLPLTGFWASGPVQGFKLSTPSVLLFIVLLILPMSRLKTASLRRTVRLPTASLSSSLRGGVLLVGATVLAVEFLSVGNVAKLGIGLATALVCLSLVPLAGWGGQISICQLTFAGIGAYVMSKMGHGGNLFGYVAAAGFTGLVGAIIALPALRLRGLYLALATLAFASAMDNMLFPWSAIFGFDGSVAISRPNLFGWHISGDKAFDIFLAITFALLSIGLLVLRRGPFGRVLIAMKDSEAACATLGLSLTMTKLAVFTLSAAIAGLAGALLAGANSVAGATDYQMFYSLLVLAAVAVGGVSLCTSALVGGLAIGFLPSSIEGIFIGVGALFLARFSEGLLPAFFEWLRRPFATPLQSAPGRPIAGAAPPLVGSAVG